MSYEWDGKRARRAHLIKFGYVILASAVGVSVLVNILLAVMTP